MIASDLMTRNPAHVRPEDTIGAAAALMSSSDVGAVPVVDGRDGGRLVGVLTDRDITIRCTAKHHDPMKCSVEDHMTKDDLATVRADTPLDELVDKMERAQIRRIPVVDARRHLVGVIGQADLARTIGADNPAVVEEVLVYVTAPTPSPSSR